jgi:hypothetical protein
MVKKLGKRRQRACFVFHEHIFISLPNQQSADIISLCVDDMGGDGLRLTLFPFTVIHSYLFF